MAGKDFLTEYHSDKLNKYRDRIVGDISKIGPDSGEDEKEGFIEFVSKVKYLKCNIPFDTLDALIGEEIMDKKCREYSIVEGSHKGKLELYEDIYQSYLDSVNEQVYRKGLSFVFYGCNESGKTFSAIHALATAIERGMSGYYIHFKDLLNVYNNAEFGRETGEVKLFRHILNCDFLVVDEIGKESSVTENVVGVFERVVKHRDEDSLPTILVTNVNFPDNSGKNKSPNGFKGRYGNSVHNCLIKRYRVLQFSKNNNFRKKTRKDWDI